jgi:hypothetical protein
MFGASTADKRIGMSNGFFRVGCVVAMVACAHTAAAQSLADVARAEASRRKALGKAATKVYTNDDLKGDNGAPGPAADASAAKPEGSTPPATAAPAPAPGNAPSGPATAAAATAAAPPPPPAPDNPPNDEKYWRNRMVTARAALQRSQSFAEALQSHINGLWAEREAMGDPIQRAAIEKKRNEAIAELDRVKSDIGQQTKAIAAIEEEARRASVPPGWLR